jgi:hypothetical protein
MTIQYHTPLNIICYFLKQSKENISLTKIFCVKKTDIKSLKIMMSDTKYNYEYKLLKRILKLKKTHYKH